MRGSRLAEAGVSRVVLGAMALGPRTAAAQAARMAALEAALDCGVTAIDTAPLYGFGSSEELVGRAIRRRRERVVVLTKVGLRWDDPRGRALFEFEHSPGVRRVVRKCSRPDSIRHEVVQSLARLGVECIDLLQVHHPDLDTPFADTFGALVELRRAGRIREIGVCNFGVAQLEAARRALGDVPLASVQLPYSLLERSAERDLLPYARQHGIAVLVYSPLYKGLLAGSVDQERRFAPDDFRGGLPGFQPAVRARVNQALHSTVAPIARRHGASVAQIALAWVLAQADVASVIAGASSPAQARENAAAAEVRLSDAEVLAIGRGFEGIAIGRRSLRERLVRRLRAMLPARANP